MTLGETLHAVIADNLSSYSPGAHLVGNHTGAGAGAGAAGGAGLRSMPPPCSVAATGQPGSHRRKEPSISGSLAPPASATPNNNNNNSGIRARCAFTVQCTGVTLRVFHNVLFEPLSPTRLFLLRLSLHSVITVFVRDIEPLYLLIIFTIINMHIVGFL